MLGAALLCLCLSFLSPLKCLVFMLCACPALQECWAEDSKARPSFEAAHVRLTAQLAAARGHLTPGQAACLAGSVTKNKPASSRAGPQP